MNLRWKIFLGFGITLGLIVVVWIWAIFNLGWLGNASDAILSENYRSILAAENMIDTIERQDSGILLVLLGYREEGLQQFRSNESEFLQWLARAKDNITIEGEAEILQAIEEEYVAFLTAFSQLREREIAGDDALPYYHEQVLLTFEFVRNKSIELRNLNQETMVAASRRAQQIGERAVWTTLAVGAIAVLLGLAFSLWLSRILVRPLQEMALTADRIAEGDYDVELSVDSKDELGHLAERIQTMTYKLKTFHRMNVGQVIAEKRRSEAIIRSITDGIVVVDADLNIIAINPEAARILQVEPDAVKGEHFYDAVENQQLYECVREVARNGRSPHPQDADDLFVLERGERTEYYRFSITPARTESGQTLGVVLLLQDVTKLKQLDRLKSDFVATASHELRTPLTSIAMSVKLLTEEAAGKLSERERKLLAAAEEDVERLRTLVDDLLDLSKIESGRMEMDFQSVEVELLVEKAVAPFEGQAQEKGVELSWQLPEERSTVRADPTKIIWVLTNLISNALRYTDRGGYVRISAAEGGNRLYLSVADNGAGIPLDYQSKIFDKFVQVNGGRTVGGSGLGLAISREIVNAHGGTIWVESEPGEGSTFTFTVPVAAQTTIRETKGEERNGKAKTANSHSG